MSALASRSNCKLQIANRKFRSGGFTLTELIIAMGIFTFGAVAVLALFSAGMVAHRRALDRSISALAAQNLVDEYRHKFTRNLKPHEDSAWNMVLAEELDEYPGYRYQTTVEPILDTRNTTTKLYDAYLLRIDIMWGPEDNPRYERFHTVILRQMDLEED